MIRCAILPILLLPLISYAVSVTNSDKTKAQAAEKAQKVLAKRHKQCVKKCIAKAQAAVSPWKGTNVGAGAVINTGNTRSQSYNLQTNLHYQRNQWQFSGLQTYQRNETAKDGVTANRLYLQGQLQYNFVNRNYAFTQVNYTDDRFDGYNYTGNWNIGYGRNIPMPENMTLNFQGGPGIQHTVPRDTDKVHDFPNLQLQGNYTWQINDQVEFKQDIQTNLTNQNTRTTFTTSLSASLFAHLSFQINFQAINDTDPQPNKAGWSTITTLNLVYNFA